MNVRNSGALMVAGYQNNGDPGTANNCFRWGPGATNGSMNVRGNLALSSGGGAISLIASNGSQYTTISQTGVSFNTTGNQEYIAPAIGFGTSASTNYRVRIKGATSTSTGYGLQVQNSSNDQILSIRDDGAFALGKGATPSISQSVVIGDTATANQRGISIGYSTTSGDSGVTIGWDAGVSFATGRNINIGYTARASGLSSILLTAANGNGPVNNTENYSFSVYMTSQSTPDFTVVHDGNSYITGTGNFGVGITNPTDRIQVPTSIGIIGDSTNAGKLKLYCEAGTAHHVAIEGPAHSGGSTYTIKLPASAPSAGQVLASDANGNLSWKSPHQLDFSGLPTSDPGVEGRLYNDEGTLKVSIP